MDASKIQIAKLNGTSNYQVWSIKMKMYLIAQDLWDVVEISTSKVTDPNLRSQNSKALSIIFLSCEDHIIRLLDPNDLAVTAWKKLEKQYGQVGFSARHLSFQSLNSTLLSSCNNVDHFIDQFRAHVTTLSQMTANPIPQWLLLSILINNVGNQYEAWTQSVMQQVRNKTISEDSQTYLDEVIASLIDEARRVGQSIELNSNSAMTARKGPKPKPICKHCGKIHKSDNCWEMFPEKRPSARFSSSNQTSSENNQFQNQSDGIAFLSQNKDGLEKSWILDSGATQHMCNDKLQFLNLEPFSTTITTANNTKMNATGKGTVKLMTKDGNFFTLLNVLYVPQLASNLLSVCYATRNPNIHFHILNGECRITFNNKLIATAKSHESLFILETARPSAHSSKTTDSLTWHKRLGHMNSEFMAKEQIKSSIGNIDKYTCEVCLKNKSTRIISRISPIKAKRPLQKIHTDLAGPITPISLGGNRYVVTFTDDFSRFSWVFLCNEKSGCFEAFKEFKKMVENEFDQKIAFLHCDNGGEYTSNEFKRFARKEGIQLQYTVPHSPEQNGVAERLNRVLFDMTRCFINDSPHINKTLWAELLKTACYLKNRLPTSSNTNFLSPYEVLYKIRPSIDHLRIIGSKCFYHMTGKIIGKLDERSNEGFLVGYESQNIFRVFDPKTQKVLRCRDVIIYENAKAENMQSQNSEIDHDTTFTGVIESQPKDLTTPTIQHISSIPNTSGLPAQRESTIYSSPQVPGKYQSFDTSLDELADPLYDPEISTARTFVSKCIAATSSAEQFLPESFEQAISCEESFEWKHSMRDEMKSITENSTWKLVPVPENKREVIQGRWVFRTKTDSNGKIAKYKSRWVVKGFQQEEGFNYTDTFASVVKPMSYKILFNIAASLNLDIQQMDVKTAFLNSPINEEVYVEQPHGFEVDSMEEDNNLKIDLSTPNNKFSKRHHTFPKNKRGKSNLVCKLERALYGLKQAPRAWYDTLSAFMIKANLHPLKSDHAVFVNKARTLYIAVYVDDILIFGSDSQEISTLKEQLHQRFNMTDLGPAHMYLGMEITRDYTSNTLSLNQQKYIQVVLNRFKMTDCNPVSTPMETGIKLSKRIDIATPFEKNQYQKLIGCLEYAAMATRPDITFAVHSLAQFSSNPDTIHFNAAKRILRYLKGSLNFGLVFKGNKSENFQLLGYSDADWAGSTHDRKSIGGYCFYLNNSLISHMSKKQKTIALSTAESETHAAIQATKEAIWLRNFLEELSFKQNQPTTILCDNQAAIALSHNPEFHSRSKHVDIQYHFLRQHVELKTVDLKYVGTEEMAADGLTKALSRYKHNRFCQFMQGENIMNVQVLKTSTL